MRASFMSAGARFGSLWLAPGTRALRKVLSLWRQKITRALRLTFLQGELTNEQPRICKAAPSLAG